MHTRKAKEHKKTVKKKIWQRDAKIGNQSINQSIDQSIEQWNEWEFDRKIYSGGEDFCGIQYSFSSTTAYLKADSSNKIRKKPLICEQQTRRNVVK